MFIPGLGYRAITVNDVDGVRILPNEDDIYRSNAASLRDGAELIRPLLNSFRTPRPLFSSLRASTSYASSEFPSLEDAKKAFKKAPGGSEDESGAFSAWLNHCSTPEEARAAFRKTSRESYEDAAFGRWLELCTTPEEARAAFRGTSRESYEDAAFSRWLELCSTPEEARAAYRATSNASREELAKKRIKELGG